MSETVAAAGNIFKRIWEHLAGRYKKLTETIEKLSTTINELNKLIYTKLKELYIPKYYVITKEIPLTEVNKKVDFVKLERRYF